MARSGIFKGLAAIASICAVFGALFLAVAEGRALAFLRLSEPDQLQKLAESPPQIAPSTRTTRDLLFACEAALLGEFYPVQPIDVQDRVTANCAKLALAAAERAPTWSFAHYIAGFSSEASDAVAVNEIRLSQKHAPYETWLAIRRFEFAIDAGLQNEIVDAFESDIMVLLQNDTGRTHLVAAYDTDDVLRERILELDRQ